ncbi:hypothetical protein TNCV_477601 [Trichonephila clavipes]|nr:hypothetical protein TNCV_477601 [Trichonephila clavipes]
MPEWNETLRCNLINTGCRDIDGVDDLSEILCMGEVPCKLRSSILRCIVWRFRSRLSCLEVKSLLRNPKIVGLIQTGVDKVSGWEKIVDMHVI